MIFLRQIFYLLLLITLNAIHAGLQDRLFDNDNVPSKSLIELLEVLTISHEGTLESIVQATQKHFLVTGKEGWQMTENPAYDSEVLTPLLTKLGFFESVLPEKKFYEGVIFPGGNVWSVRQRLAYLVKLWQQGCRFKNITVMTGEHPLDQGRYSAEDLFNYQHPDLPLKKEWQAWSSFPTNEAEMICMVFEQVQLPKELCDIPLVTIVSTMDPITGKRPTTYNNVMDFLAHQPVPGTYLVISNQPYLGYQDSVFLSYLPANITIETVGDQSLCTHTMTQYIDRLARWIYQESIRRKN